MKSVILFLWQLPQNLIGLILKLILIGKYVTREFGVSANKTVKVHFAELPYQSGISLGNFIFLDDIYLELYEKNQYDIMFDVKHEYGHHIQSLMLGWLYLPVVGLWSFVRAIYARIKHKSFYWYYSGFPENWANDLGGV